MKKKKYFHIGLTQEQINLLKKYSDKLGIPLATYIRFLILQHIENDIRPKEGKQE